MSNKKAKAKPSMKTKARAEHAAAMLRELDDLEDRIDPEVYSELCDWFWRLDYPETPDDGMRHTSDVCRDRAMQVYQIFLGPRDEQMEQFIGDIMQTDVAKNAYRTLLNDSIANGMRHDLEQAVKKHLADEKEKA